MTAKHTPTPWSVSTKCPVAVENEDGAIILIIAATGDIDQGQSDAAFIVRACNAHKDLVTALEDLADTAHALLNHIPAASGALSVGAHELSEKIDAARTALAKIADK